ncbi:ABC-2 type transport system permease protein [Lewinella aquimaris]|uniref:ABC-2 type transport system permease protein n=1 Tax=Neolewinella aquimaris TaxID=1835722 RepID=A0A840E5M6_9BACT|nr:ABC transporter permease [Neolewinella aquimaris]MBB4079263.1 ABC-2 type transport system permease protein [Neolewinella aquimaris]
MSNLWLVVRREYVTRVRRRSFILATLLTPIGLALFVVIANAVFSYSNDDVQRIAVIDDANLFKGSIPDENGLYFKFVDQPLEDLREDAGEDRDYAGILVIPKVTNPRSRNYRVQLLSDETLSIDAQSRIRNRVEDALREYKIEALNIDQATLASLDTDVKITVRSLTTTADGESDDRSMASAIGAGIGSVMGFLMYISVFVYGMMVMRSVMEEKTNRIVEVVISSVRPFTLLLGKIIGVGAVGLTQVVAWMIMIPGMLFLVGIFFGLDADPGQMPNSPDMNPEEMQSMVEKLTGGLADLNWWIILPCFILYFLGGYFMYAALFAAVGSAMGDDMGESQSLTIPITIPVILAFYIMMAAIQNPNSSLAVWSSIFPLFAPIVMPARLAFDPPLWQVLASLVSVFLFAAAMVWMASRIYRIGILNYGKKSTLRDMGRWITAKY